jgi:hypothetical protein
VRSGSWLTFVATKVTCQEEVAALSSPLLGIFNKEIAQAE